MHMVEVQCRTCGKEDEALQRAAGIEPCACGGERERVYTLRPEGGAVHQDSIEGGVWMKHGICNEDGSAKRYDSRRDIRQALDKAGLRPIDEPIPVLDGEIERNLSRHGYKNTPRVVAVPGVLSAADEAARVAHWRAREAELQQELAK